MSTAGGDTGSRGGQSPPAGPGGAEPPGTGRSLVGQIADVADERKARDIVAIDLRGMVVYTDCFLLCTGNTERQTKAIHDAIADTVRREHGVRPRRVEGLAQGHWIVMDYLDVVVHILTPATRAFYRLESLWGEAPIEQLGAPLAELAGGQAVSGS